MPGMNGIELYRAIKQDIETSHIPFIMLPPKARNELIIPLDARSIQFPHCLIQLEDHSIELKARVVKLQARVISLHTCSIQLQRVQCNYIPL